MQLKPTNVLDITIQEMHAVLGLTQMPFPLSSWSIHEDSICLFDQNVMGRIESSTKVKDGTEDKKTLCSRAIGIIQDLRE
jgi:hypothetical protein